MDSKCDDLAAMLYQSIAADGDAVEEPFADSPPQPQQDQQQQEQPIENGEVIVIDENDSFSDPLSGTRLSEILDVIKDQLHEDDPKISNTTTMYPINHPGNYNNNNNITNPSEPPPPQPRHAVTGGVGVGGSSSGRSRTRPHTEIIEQPAPKALRFRYECEGRSAGSIPGIRSTSENKTFPSIRVVGHRGEAFVVVSCVTKDPPYKPHPHNLVGRDCKTGVCTVKMTADNMSITFNNLGIQCIRKKDIEEALKKREQIKVDPFKTGFGHRSQPSSIDLNAIRLCFQVFVSYGPTGPNGQNNLVAIQPVISEPIYDKKAMSELVITKLSHCSAPVSGGKEVILLCEKVAKEDIAVRFYEEQDGQVVWEATGEFQHNNVHKQVAICFKTPPYRLLQLDHVTRVFLQLKRPSDGATSDPVTFDYLPVEAEQMPKRKKMENRQNLYDFVNQQQQQQQQQQMQRQTVQQGNVPGGFPNLKVDPIKEEPRDHSPGHYNLSPFGSPLYQMQDNLQAQTQQQQQQQQPFKNNLFNIPETLPQGTLFPNDFQQPLTAPKSVSPNCLPVTVETHPQQQQQQFNTFANYPANTQTQQWNIPSGTTGRENNLSSSTATMNPFHQPQQGLFGAPTQHQQQQQTQQQQLQQQQQSQDPVPMNINPDGLLDSNDFAQLTDMLAAPTENMTDSFTKMYLKEFPAS